MSRYLVYTSCFHQEAYTDVVKFLIDSFFAHKTSPTIDFLVYTTSEYRAIIESKCAGKPIIFYEKNFYKTMNQARISKMDIFDYSEISNYDKILYLDADSIVMRDLTCVFDAIETDKIYAHAEGSVLGGVYWGDYLFLKENPNYPNVEALSVNALGMKNLPEHKKTFAKIKQAFYLDMYQNKLQFYDQPHINFHLIHNGLAELAAFKPLIQNRSSAEYAIKTEAAVIHMAGCPGHSNIKMDLCREFMRDYERLKPIVSEAIVSVAIENPVLESIVERKCCPTCNRPFDA
jgi:hypothetical protein